MKTYISSFTYLKFSLHVNGHMFTRAKNIGNYCVEKNQMHFFFLYIFSITVMISKIITEK